jgi:hypothetical protein
MNEKLLQEERDRMRKEHESEMVDLKRKMEAEKETKAAMASEIEGMKKDYEHKLKDLEENVAKAKATQEANPMPAGGITPSARRGRSHSIVDGDGNVVRVPGEDEINGGVAVTAAGKRKTFNEMQQEAKMK